MGGGKRGRGNKERKERTNKPKASNIYAMNCRERRGRGRGQRAERAGGIGEECKSLEDARLWGKEEERGEGFVSVCGV